ncbi:restriction endonuclease subunit S [Xylella fastidiosa]|nr:restriction endonuclease subunit S [Xylella fastidiosa]OCA57018.1 type I restriction-modification system specificity determinant [Xylella fastidiosa subsp. pauca 11399]ALQ95719.1 type I restriction-modification system specificity determinant [Xylella fastidiosa]ALR02906.1 type I restriction-modification system specificity determinant [Xylella fastidiosa]MDG5823166.1 restriction endonuclease subunit S [Xylella fastidiosa subsp. pauca]NRP55095.1 type I restriction-modification system specific
MVGEWRSSNWGDEVTLEYGKAIRGYSQTHGKCRVFGSNGPIGWTSYAMTQGPGVVLGRKGAYRGVEFCHESFWVIDTAYYLVPKTDLDMRWLYYAVKHYKLGEVDDGSPIPSTTRAAVYMLELDVPPKHEQHAIAKILGTLDDKIELNRRTNETLEAMARALFKAWCVDFEPVRAKLEGRWQRGESLPGLPAHLYDLFPARLIESEWGEIPEGWRVDSLGKVAVHLRRSVQPSEIKDETSYIALEHMPKRCIALAEWGVANGIESNKYEFKQGEILFGKLRPYFHKVGVAPVDGVCSTDIVVIAPILPTWFGFVLVHVSSDAFVEYTNAGSTGTKMPRTSWSEMAQYPVVLPHEDVAVAFNQHIQALSEEIIIKIHESRSLVQLRDTLLPKLISGELRVPDAERITGAAL